MEGSDETTSITTLLPRYPMDLPARFDDDRGAEQTVIHNDGHELRMTLRGVDLVGQWLDDFAPATPSEPDRLPFATKDGALWGGKLTITLPAPLRLAAGLEVGSMEAELTLGPAESLRLTLAVPGYAPFESCGAHGWFDDELSELIGSLPPEVRLIDCYTCGLSDYGPGGYGLFGCLACFRGAKETYRGTRGKRDVQEAWASRTEWVQETHLCPEWEPRPPGRGYRG